MKNTLIILFVGSIASTACRKGDISQPITKPEPCALQTANPVGRSYSSDSIVAYTCTQKHCGIFPLSPQNYWVYEDSLFTDGVFMKVQYDTLRYLSNKVSVTDGLVWWEGNISVGLPDILYASDSSFFGLAERLFMPGFMDVRKDFGLFPGDSLRYLTSFEDAAAQGRSLKLNAPIITKAGTFNNCLYFEKNARYFRKDQVYFQPGTGVIKYVTERVPIGTRVLQLERVATLVAFFIR